MMLCPQETAIRLECLKLALEQRVGNPVDEARRYADFVTGRNDARLRELVSQFREAVVAT